MDINSENTVVYTALIGHNEFLNSQPQIKNSKLRHICFTDNENLSSDDWEIVYVKRLFPMDQHRSQRNLKIRPHLLFPNYKYSFYFDNTIVLKKKAEDLINQIFLKDISYQTDPLFVLPYSTENLISEFINCFTNKLDSDTRILDQITDYLLVNSIVFKYKTYWGAMIFRSHMHQEVKNFAEIWFANVLRYSRRDQLSIIHSELQSNLKIRGINIGFFSSKYHYWPVNQIERKHRSSPNNIYKLPLDFFQEIYDDFSLNDDEIKKIDFRVKINEAILKFKNSFNESDPYENIKLNEEKRKLINELNAIKHSKIWSYTYPLRLLIDKLKSFYKKL